MTQAAILAASGSPGTTTGFKNRIINGGMTVNQRAWTSTSIAQGSTYTVDRWWTYSRLVGSKYSIAQSTSAPTGFINSLLVTSSSAYSVAAGDIFYVSQLIEGLNIADLAWGTANAKTITLSFWVNSSLTGTFGGALQNNDSNYNYPFSYTISTANTWQQVSITIPGPTSGSWLTTNSCGIQILISLGAGSTYGNGTAGAWTTSNYVSVTGAVSVVGTSGATWAITGAQLEVGTTATNFDFRSYGTELALCQRYYIRYANGTGQRLGVGDRYATTFIQCMTFFPTEMRTAPTLVATTGSGYYIFYQGGVAHTFNSFTLDSGGTTSKIAVMYNSGDTSGTVGQCGMYQTNNASGSVAFNAEL